MRPAKILYNGCDVQEPIHYLVVEFNELLELGIETLSGYLVTGHFINGHFITGHFITATLSRGQFITRTVYPTDT